MTLHKLLKMGLVNDDTEIWVCDFDMYVLAYGNWHHDNVLKYLDKELEHFVWHDDSKVSIHLKREGGIRMRNEYRVRYWRQGGAEEYMEFITVKQAQEFYDSMGGMAEINLKKEYCKPELHML